MFYTHKIYYVLKYWLGNISLLSDNPHSRRKLAPQVDAMRVYGSLHIVLSSMVACTVFYE